MQYILMGQCKFSEAFEMYEIGSGGSSRLQFIISLMSIYLSELF